MLRVRVRVCFRIHVRVMVRVTAMDGGEASTGSSVVEAQVCVVPSCGELVSVVPCCAVLPVAINGLG